MSPVFESIGRIDECLSRIADLMSFIPYPCDETRCDCAALRGNHMALSVRCMQVFGEVHEFTSHLRLQWTKLICMAIPIYCFTHSVLPYWRNTEFAEK